MERLINELFGVFFYCFTFGGFSGYAKGGAFQTSLSPTLSLHKSHSSLMSDMSVVLNRLEGEEGGVFLCVFVSVCV